MSKAIKVDDANFESEVVEAGIPVLVDFWGPSCGPCKMLAPTIDELAEDYEGRIRVAKMNVEEAQQVAMALGIRSIPAVALFDGSEVVDVIVGFNPKIAFSRMIDKYMKKREKILKKEEKQQAKLAAKAARKEAAA